MAQEKAKWYQNGTGQFIVTIAILLIQLGAILLSVNSQINVVKTQNEVLKSKVMDNQASIRRLEGIIFDLYKEGQAYEKP